jgi:hypothetical protein
MKTLICVGAMFASVSAPGAEDVRSRLVYSSEFARKMVQVMQVDCKMDDGRYLPLEDLLLARLARPLPEGFRLTMVAEKEKQSYRVRIIETLHNRDRVVDTRWRFAVTEDGGRNVKRSRSSRDSQGLYRHGCGASLEGAGYRVMTVYWD